MFFIQIITKKFNKFMFKKIAIFLSLFFLQKLKLLASFTIILLINFSSKSKFLLALNACKYCPWT